jgi:peptidoglycan-associated lipoprotein
MRFDMFKVVLFGTMILSLTGCPPKKKPMSVEPPPEEAQMETPAPGTLEIGTDWVNAPLIPAVYFEVNKAELRPEARDILKKNAAVLKAVLGLHPSVMVRVEGHCDERGTLEYNLALGERRARAVRDFYASLGVNKAALSTISYGEERPVCTQNTENCWWKNRRGETTLKSSGGPIRVPPDQLPQAR